MSHSVRCLSSAAELEAWGRFSSEAGVGNLYQCPWWADPLKRYGVRWRVIGVYKEERLVGGGLFRSVPIPYAGLSLTQCLQGPVFREWDPAWADELVQRIAEVCETENSISAAIETCPHEEARRGLAAAFARAGQRIFLRPGPTEVVLSLEGRDLDSIWRGFSKGTKRSINRGQKNNLEIRRLREPKDLLQAHAAWMATAARKGFSDVRPWAAMEPVLRRSLDLDQGLVLASYQEGRLVAAIFVALVGDTAAYAYGGFMDGGEQSHPNHILHYEAIRECLARGVKAYNFGNLVSGALDQFKLGFGSAPLRRPDTIVWARRPLFFRSLEWLRRQRAGRAAMARLKRWLLGRQRPSCSKVLA